MPAQDCLFKVCKRRQSLYPTLLACLPQLSNIPMVCVSVKTPSYPKVVVVVVVVAVEEH